MAGTANLENETRLFILIKLVSTSNSYDIIVFTYTLPVTVIDVMN